MWETERKQVERWVLEELQMVDNGSRMSRFQLTQESAWDIIQLILEMITLEFAYIQDMDQLVPSASTINASCMKLKELADFCKRTGTALRTQSMVTLRLLTRSWARTRAPVHCWSLTAYKRA